MNEKWELKRGWADWGMPCQHDIVQGEEHIAGVPSITPYCMGASAKDKNYAARQWKRAQLLVAAPDLLEACKACAEICEDGDTGADFSRVVEAMNKAKAAVDRAEGKNDGK